MLGIGSRFDQLDWDKVEVFLQETFRSSPMQPKVYVLPKTEGEPRENVFETEQRSFAYLRTRGL